MYSYLIPADYLPTARPEAAGNPLLEALPPLMSADDTNLLLSFGRRPTYSDDERMLSAGERMLCVGRLNDYLLMMASHGEIIEQIGLILDSGYVHRNPALPEFQRSLVEFYRQRLQGRITPIESSGPSTAPSFALFGVSGMGKSTVVERTLSFYPRALSHEKYGFYQIVWMKIDCPMDGSLKQLLLSIVAKVDSTLGTNHSKSVNGRVPTDKLILDVAKIAAQHHLGVLVIDEVQHLLAAKGVGMEKLLNFFVTFTNDVKVPIIVLGTPKAKVHLEQLFREARRVGQYGSALWDRMALGREWDYFLKVLWKYQWLQKAEDLSPEVSEAMYHQTQGITALVIRLFQLVQLQAIRGKSERITVSLINKVAKEKFSLLRPALDALRSGDNDRIAKFEDLISSGVTTLKTLTTQQQAVQSIKVAEKRLNERRIQLTSNLLHAGASPSIVGALVDEVLTPSGTTTPAKKSPPKVPNKLIEALRKAEAENADPVDALRSAGLIDDLVGQ
ncbi:AAA family ATPase [Bradyrhizobium sp. CB1717]|uniref:AAA family ATPase n=1 Tax=Bradyrhizobium sp. CB1717 TaxID=3039154 RepID=UPI0024B0DFD3|nr:AAA family ATPase [Bradyrhizobium sp. CB1717]WFU24966.1 AAA family ATPase [Bradyrhizobium sp. CB1717]